jgi:hypothetical protein
MCEEVQTSRPKVQTNPKVQRTEPYDAGISQFLNWNWFLGLDFELRALNFFSVVLRTERSCDSCERSDPASAAILQRISKSKENNER